MAIPKRLLNALEKHKVKYHVLPHKTVFTAYDLATTLGEDLKKVAKTLLVRADKRYVLVVLPASARLDFKKLAKLLKAKTVSISPEAAIKKLKVMPGTTPPFGSLLGVPVVFEQMLLKAGDIIVRAGSLTESLRMKVKDFVKMESPILGTFRDTAKKVAAKKPKGAGAKKKT
ncbi:MAG: YbaK/EbsC family protein [bacterium]|nr:YbaK/EbsC family protein [bacterium]